MMIMQHHRQTIDFRLDHVSRPRHALIHTQDALIPGAHIRRPKGVRQAENGRRVAHLDKFLRRLASSALRG